MFSFSFPDCVQVRCVHRDASTSCLLHPEEEQLLSPQAVEKRRREFLMGRTAARLALQELGIAPPPAIMRGERREPLWPQGIVGSITHAGDYAVAAVAREANVLSIGIDIEKVKQRHVTEIGRTIADADEQRWIQQDPNAIVQRTLLIFSAKESVFKALYPLCQVFLDYSAVSLKADSEGKFTAVFSEQTKSIFSQNAVLASREALSIEYKTYQLEDTQEYVQTSTYLI